MGRTGFGVACVSVLFLVGCASEDAPTDVVAGAESPVRTEEGELLVTCGDRPPFSAAAFDDGVVADDIEDGVGAALDRLNTTAGIDAPLRGTSADAADWRILSVAPVDEPTAVMVAVGPWARSSGPVRGGMYVYLQRAGDGWKPMSWGHCRPEPVLVSDALTWVEIKGTRVGRDPASSTVAVRVYERECTSARDPSPYLNVPYVVETDESITIYWTSDVAAGNQTCPGNPSVERTVELDAALGERTVLDGSTWPRPRSRASERNRLDSGTRLALPSGSGL